MMHAVKEARNNFYRAARHYISPEDARIWTGVFVQMWKGVYTYGRKIGLSTKKSAELAISVAQMPSKINFPPVLSRMLTTDKGQVVEIERAQQEITRIIAQVEHDAPIERMKLFKIHHIDEDVQRANERAWERADPHQQTVWALYLNILERAMVRRTTVSLMKQDMPAARAEGARIVREEQFRQWNRPAGIVNQKCFDYSIFGLRKVARKLRKNKQP